MLALYRFYWKGTRVTIAANSELEARERFRRIKEAFPLGNKSRVRPVRKSTAGRVAIFRQGDAPRYTGHHQTQLAALNAFDAGFTLRRSRKRVPAKVYRSKLNSIQHAARYAFRAGYIAGGVA